VIPCAKSRLFDRWFSRHAERRIRGHFGAVRIAGREHFARATAAAPVLVVCNHTSWWDPLWILALARRIHRVEAFALMDAGNLTRNPFFTRVGAFGVDRSDPADGASAIRYAARLLREPGRVVFIFPQGEERPSSVRPLGFLGGAAAIARVAKAALVIPMALRYEHGSTARPTLYAAIGAPLEDRSAAAQERAVTELLEGSDPSAYETWWSHTPSPWPERLLAALTPLR